MSKEGNETKQNLMGDLRKSTSASLGMNELRLLGLVVMSNSARKQTEGLPDARTEGLPAARTEGLPAARTGLRATTPRMEGLLAEQTETFSCLLSLK